MSGTIPALVTPTGQVGGPRTKGIDVSKWQGSIDWAKVKGAGIDFGIARVSDGLNYPDAYFLPNWNAMKAQGMVRGVYQFFRPSLDPIKQADYLLSKVGTFAPGDLPPFCDVETLDGVSEATAVAQMKKWLDYVQQKTGLTPAIYSSKRMWNILQNPTGYSMNDFWVANWGTTSPAMPTVNWKDWTFWQYTATNRVNGVNGDVDTNYYNGSVRDLQAYAGLPAANGFFRGLAVNSTGKGYWQVTNEGGILSYGDATFRGTFGGRTHAKPILGIVRTPTGLGYWVYGADGNVKGFGDGELFGTLAGQTLVSPVVGMAATKTGKGYWLLHQDGGLKAFGDALLYGQPMPAQIGKAVGIAATPTGKGYWIAAEDGNVFAYGDAVLKGRGTKAVAIASTRSGQGYWLAEANGKVLSFGDAMPFNDPRPVTLRSPIVSITPSLTGLGYWLATGDGTVFALGDAFHAGARPR